jgi:hypothetical protein
MITRKVADRWAGLNEIAAIFGSGFVVVLLYLIRNSEPGLKNLMPLLFLNIPFLSQENMKIFWIFLKIGAILYGSVYVLFAFSDSEPVGRGLLTRTQLVDVIAVGQFTPGSVFSSVAFYWLANEWNVGGYISHGRCLPAFICFCYPVKPAGAPDAKVPFVLSFSGWCEYSNCFHHTDRLHQFCPGDHFGLAVYSDYPAQPGCNI